MLQKHSSHSRWGLVSVVQDLYQQSAPLLDCEFFLSSCQHGTNTNGSSSALSSFLSHWLLLLPGGDCNRFGRQSPSYTALEKMLAAETLKIEVLGIVSMETKAAAMVLLPDAVVKHL